MPRRVALPLDRLVDLALPILAVLLALAVGAGLLWGLGVDPLTAYGAMVRGALGNTSGITQTLTKATPLLLVGLGICIAFRGGVINIGGEGQIIVGALAATALALAFPQWPRWPLLVLTLLVGALAGPAYIPEERMVDGVIREFTVAENLILHDHVRPPFSRGPFLNFREIARHSWELVRRFQVKTPDIRTPTKSLSGGNIQKLILARELSRNPKVLVAAQPTRGVDIGAMEYIHQQLLEQRAQGTATLLISEDLDELLALSDRIAVIYEGRIMDVVAREETSAQELGLLMAGIHPAEA